MDIRHVSPQGLTPQTISRFLHESATVYPNEIGSPDLVEWPVKLASHADVFCTQRPDGSLSAALFAYLNDQTGHRGYIPFICSLPECGKGTAHILHAAMCEQARAVGMTSIQLEVLKSNAHAITFYHRQGYEVVADHADRNRWLMGLGL